MKIFLIISVACLVYAFVGGFLKNGFDIVRPNSNLPIWIPFSWPLWIVFVPFALVGLWGYEAASELFADYEAEENEK